MNISPEATGKIMGMLMAYAVSSLGLLLAYINYRKRVIRAERVFTLRAKIICGAVITLAVGGVIAFAVTAGGTFLTGVAVPLLIFLVSFAITWLLYLHFSRGSGR